MKRDIEIKFLYSFDISSIEQPLTEKYDRNTGKTDGEGSRWIMHLKKDGDQHRDKRDCSIWQWASEGDIKQSDAYRLFEDVDMKLKLSDPPVNVDDVANSDINNQVIPVIVQPSTDGWKNFVRQVHSAKLDGSGEYEFTLVFNDEHLRRHGMLESLYRFLRPLLYGRLTDLESFKVILKGDTASHFVFPGIYSGKSSISEDSVHGDKESFFRKAPRRKIKYYYSNRMHPIVFINSANHAMAEQDNNGSLWKWEFVPWETDSPIVHGNKSREQIEELVKNLDENKTVNRIANIMRQQNIRDKMLTYQKLRKQYVDDIRREYIVNKSTAEKLLTEAIAHL